MLSRLNHLPHPAPTPTTEPALIDLRQLARLLSVSTRTARRLATSGQVPGMVRIGTKLLRFQLEVVRSWIAAGCPAREAQT